MITKLSENKENMPPPRSGNRKSSKDKTWIYCYSCGANQSHPSNKCTSKGKQTNHKDAATFKNTMGGNTHRCHYDEVRELMN